MGEALAKLEELEAEEAARLEAEIASRRAAVEAVKEAEAAQRPAAPPVGAADAPWREGAPEKPERQRLDKVGVQLIKATAHEIELDVPVDRPHSLNGNYAAARRGRRPRGARRPR